MNTPVKILVECPEYIASVKVGVIEPLKAVSNICNCDFKFIATRNIKRKDIAWCDILITVRGCELATGEIVKAARACNRFIIYFLDDDILNLPDNIPTKKYFEDEGCEETLLYCLKNSNLLWSSNKNIIDKYSKFFDGSCLLSDIPVEIKPDVLQNRKKKDKVKILFAGSSDHSVLIKKYLRKPIEELCDELGNKVEFTFIGAKPGIQGRDNVKFYSFFENYDEYKKFVTDSGFQIGLAVIETTDFFRCKYFNKFIEYTSIGAVGVYTDSEPYTLVVKDGYNGYLCQNTSEAWKNSILQAIEDVQNGDTSKVEAAIDVLINDFNYDAIGRKILEAIPQFKNYHAPVVTENKIKLNNIWVTYYLRRVRLVWKKDKLLFLPIVAYKIVKITFKSIAKAINNERK